MVEVTSSTRPGSSGGSDDGRWRGNPCHTRERNREPRSISTRLAAWTLRSSPHGDRLPVWSMSLGAFSVGVALSVCTARPYSQMSSSEVLREYCVARKSCAYLIGMPKHTRPGRADC